MRGWEWKKSNGRKGWRERLWVEMAEIGEVGWKHSAVKTSWDLWQWSQWVLQVMELQSVNCSSPIARQALDSRTGLHLIEFLPWDSPVEIYKQPKLMLGQRVDLFKLTESLQCCRTTSTKLIELGEIELVPTGMLHPKFLSLWCRKVFCRIEREMWTSTQPRNLEPTGLHWRQWPFKQCWSWAPSRGAGLKLNKILVDHFLKFCFTISSSHLVIRKDCFSFSIVVSWRPALLWKMRESGE